VQALPPRFLHPPSKEELFEDIDDCIKRLQGYALSAGFVVVWRGLYLNNFLGSF
jgi:hypothetical protein